MPAAPSLLIVPYRSKTGRLYSQIPVPVAPATTGAGDFTVTRDTTARRFNSAGLIESVASGIPRLDYYTSGGTAGCPALLVEPAATNLALHSRDLSNAVWSGTNVTRAKNAVGADGVASGATTLTATAASGTVLQAISHASQSRVFSAYVRRVTGTGAIQMTTNGGTNWTTVTISSLYTQVACAAQTVASGTVGFRMAVSGDVIEVDFTQGEVGPVATSPIPTTTGTGSRSADVISVSGAVSGSIGQQSGTVYCEFQFGNTSTNNAGVFSVESTNNLNRVLLANSTPTTCVVQVQANGSAIFTTSIGTLTVGQYYKIAVGYSSGNTKVYLNGNSTPVITNTSGYTMAAALSRIGLGTYENSSSLVTNSRIRSFSLYAERLTDAEMIALTTP